MDANVKIARYAGVLYLFFAVLVGLTQFYIPSRISPLGDAATLAGNILTHEQLFRLGIVGELLNSILLLVIALLLYKLLGSTSKNAAAGMVISVVVFVSLALIATSHKLNVLSLLHGEGYRSAMNPEGLNTLVKLQLDASSNTSSIAFLFWGSWLISLGYLLVKSTIFPSLIGKVLGLSLIVGSVAWLFESLRPILFPQYTLPPIAFVPSGLGEMGTFLWLLIAGVKRTS